MRGSGTEPLAGASKENAAQTCHQAHGHPTAALQWVWKTFPNLKRSGPGCSQGPPKGVISETHTSKWQVKTITKPGLCHRGSFPFPKTGCHTSQGLRAPESPRLPVRPSRLVTRPWGGRSVRGHPSAALLCWRPCECGGPQKGDRAHWHASRPDDVDHRM